MLPLSFGDQRAFLGLSSGLTKIACKIHMSLKERFCFVSIQRFSSKVMRTIPYCSPEFFYEMMCVIAERHLCLKRAYFLKQQSAAAERKYGKNDEKIGWKSRMGKNIFNFFFISFLQKQINNKLKC